MVLTARAREAGSLGVEIVRFDDGTDAFGNEISDGEIFCNTVSYVRGGNIEGSGEAESPGQLVRAAGPVENDETDKLCEIVVAMPHRKLSRIVATDDEVKRRLRILRGDLLHGVDRVGRRIAPQFLVAHAEALFALDGCPDHFKAEEPRRGARFTLVRVQGGRDENDGIELERLDSGAR